MALYPLDTLRTRRQAAPTTARYKTSFSSRSGPALWAGFLPSAAGAVPAQAVYYSTYSALKPTVGVAPAAAVANIVAAFIRVPPELIKQRAQAGTASSAAGIVRQIFVSDGFFGLWRGLRAQVTRDVPFAITLFSMYEIMNKCGRPGLRGGAAAGAVAAVVTAPLDLLKTRAMLANGSRTAAPSFRHVLKAEGGRVFWSGVGLRILYKICSSALFFAGVETFKNAAPLIGKHLPRPNKLTARKQTSKTIRKI